MQRLQSFLRIIEKLSKRILGKYLKSIIVFGSFARGDYAPSSDIDILIIVSDETPDSLIEKFKRISYVLERKFGFAKYSNGILDAILLGVSRMTGLGVCCFIAKETDLLQWRFEKIFTSNLFLSKLLAPATCVFYNIKSANQVISGKNFLENLQVRFKFLDLFKSLIMSELLVVCSIALTLFTKKAFYLTLTAIKWAFLNTRFRHRTKFNLLNPECVCPKFKYTFIRLINSRKTNMLDPILLYRAPFIVFLLHKLAISNALTSPRFPQEL